MKIEFPLDVMINLHTQYYFTNNAERQKEINECLLKNINNRYIGAIYIYVATLDDHDLFLKTELYNSLSYYKKSKICVIFNYHKEYKYQYDRNKMTYFDFLQTASNCTSNEFVNVLANSDIYFDETIAYVSKMKPKECYAITRHEVLEDGKAEIVLGKDSQDVWIVRGKATIDDLEQTKFPLGVAGCDNRIAYILHNSGYNVKNPATKIKCYHLHKSKFRDYRNEDGTLKELIPPPYHFLEPY